MTYNNCSGKWTILLNVRFIVNCIFDNKKNTRKRRVTHRYWQCILQFKERRLTTTRCYVGTNMYWTAFKITHRKHDKYIGTRQACNRYHNGDTLLYLRCSFSCSKHRYRLELKQNAKQACKTIRCHVLELRLFPESLKQSSPAAGFRRWFEI